MGPFTICIIAFLCARTCTAQTKTDVDLELKTLSTISDTIGQMYVSSVPQGGRVIVTRFIQDALSDPVRIEIEPLVLKEVSSNFTDLTDRAVPLRSLRFDLIYKKDTPTLCMNVSCLELKLQAQLSNPKSASISYGQLNLIISVFLETKEIVSGYKETLERVVVYPGTIRVSFSTDNWRPCGSVGATCPAGLVGAFMKLEMNMFGWRYGSLGPLQNGNGERRKNLELGNADVLFMSNMWVESAPTQTSNQNQAVLESWRDLDPDTYFTFSPVANRRTNVVLVFPSMKDYRSARLDTFIFYNQAMLSQPCYVTLVVVSLLTILSSRLF